MLLIIIKNNIQELQQQNYNYRYSSYSIHYILLGLKH